MRSLKAWIDTQPLQRLISILLVCVAAGCLALGCSDDLPLHTPGIVSLLTIAAIAAALYFLFKRGLERGISLDRWSAEELRTARLHLRTVGSRVAMVYIAVFVVAMVVRLAGQRRLSPFGTWMPLYLCSIAITSVMKLIPGPPTIPRDTPWRASLKPIHSDHWGEGSA